MAQTDGAVTPPDAPVVARKSVLPVYVVWELSKTGRNRPGKEGRPTRAGPWVEYSERRPQREQPQTRHRRHFRVAETFLDPCVDTPGEKAQGARLWRTRLVPSRISPSQLQRKCAVTRAPTRSFLTVLPSKEWISCIFSTRREAWCIPETSSNGIGFLLARGDCPRAESPSPIEHK